MVKIVTIVIIIITFSKYYFTFSVAAQVWIVTTCIVMTYLVMAYKGHNYAGHSYAGHAYLGHNCTGHNYKGLDYRGDDYTGHNCINHNSTFSVAGRRTSRCRYCLPSGAEPTTRTTRTRPSAAFFFLKHLGVRRRPAAEAGWAGLEAPGGRVSPEIVPMKPQDAI